MSRVRPFVRLSLFLLAGGLAFVMIVFQNVPMLRAQTATAGLSGTVVDQKGGALPNTHVTITNASTDEKTEGATTALGHFSFPLLPPGLYTLRVEHEGFAAEERRGIVLLVGDAIAITVELKVGTAPGETIVVNGEVSLMQTETSSTGATITPQQIETMPLNGRNYLDLLQLIPGVTLNKQQDQGSDNATPILGERAGNTVYFLDGLPMRDEVDGGPSAQFNQDSILEFQVITSGYKAEFGHGSGGAINVVSKSGTNDLHGGASFFHRNYALDSSDIPGENAPFLLRYDPSVWLGGPVVKNKTFFFVSAERIRESRELNFQFPSRFPGLLPLLEQLEAPYEKNSETYDSRYRAKVDQQLGRHHLSLQANLNNTHVTDFLPLSLAENLPSTRTNIDSRRLMVGLTDSTSLGNSDSPFFLNMYAQFRGEPTKTSPAHPQAGDAITFANLFSSYDTNMLFGDLGQVVFGPGFNELTLDQNNTALGTNVAKQLGRHTVKFGLDFERIQANGYEADNISNQIFTTPGDLSQFGPESAGVSLLIILGGQSAQDNRIRLRNNYWGPYVQDDWKITKNLMVNLGLRWDFDSTFPNKANFSPRLGVAWSVTPRTVLRANWGLYYDHFRVGSARDIPAFGGANLTNNGFVSFPRLFYGDPTIFPQLLAPAGFPCPSTNLTEAQIMASGATCPTNPNQPLLGIDFLNSVVASGHAPIPANTVINTANVQSMTGYTSDQFISAVDTALGEPAGYFTWDMFGHLSSNGVFGTQNVPFSVDPNFRTPYSRDVNLSLQRQLSTNSAVTVTYYHHDLRNILGLRYTNLAFDARLSDDADLQPGTGNTIINGYGPWFRGTYDGATVAYEKRVSRRFSLQSSYTWGHEIDNLLNSNFISELQTTSAGALGVFGPSDSFVGVPPVVSEPTGILANGQPCGGSNASAPFIACNGNPVPIAGKFYNGPNLDKGPSDLALVHTFLADGLVDLPWKLSFSGIFRAQSGFHYSQTGSQLSADGSGNFSGVNFMVGRNRFTAPPYVNMDMRVAKRFDLSEKYKLNLFFEFFNLFNNANPAAVETLPNNGQGQIPFGSTLQVLPGREGQVGVRFDF